MRERNGFVAMGVGLFLATASATGCAEGGLGLERAMAPIVDGNATTGSPATVFLWLGGGSCSGTLISPRVVLTARHCLTGVQSIDVFFGANADQQGTWIEAADWEYRNDGDIGIVLMKSNGPTDPIRVFGGPMGSLADHEGDTIHIVGFGVTGENKSDSGLKREGYTKLAYVQDEIMYTGHDLSGSWTCYGDSGGPNYMMFEGAEVLAGVTSFGTSVCGQPEDGAVRTDTYYDWIMAYIAANDPGACAGDSLCNPNCGAGMDADCGPAVPPGCEADGVCSTSCADWMDDVDCAGCGSGDTCQSDCPVLDQDCCAADGTCNDACGMTDDDCAGGDDGGGDGAGDGGGDGDNGNDPGDNDLVGGGCAASGGAGTGGLAGALMVLAALVLIRPRRRRV